MKIWILEIGEPLPLEKNVRLHRYGQFSKFLAKAGHQVTWWTNSFSHAPKQHFAERDVDHMIDGVTLRVIRGLGYKRNVSVSRIRHNKHFAKRFSELAPQYEKPDLIIAPVPIIEAAVAAIEYGKAHNVPVMTDIRDEWPDELTNLAPKPLRPLARLALKRSYNSMEKLCREAKGIMAVAERQVDYGLRFAHRERMPSDRVFHLGYSSDRPPIETLSEAEKWWQSLSLNPSALKVCFFGTLGKFFDLDTMFKALRDLGDDVPIQFIVGGVGSKLESYKKSAADLPNVIFAGWLKAPEIQVVMKHSQVGLAPYITGSAMSLPNKPFEYMSGRLALLSSIEGELATLIEKNQCGINYHSSDANALAVALDRLHSNREATRAMGERAFELWQREFTTDVIFPRIARHLEQCAAARL